MGMWHEDGMQAGFERRVDVRFRAVANHPGAPRIEPALIHQAPIGRGILLLHDGRMTEEASQAGAVDLQLLLLGMALGKQRQAMPASQIFEGFGNARDHFHGALEDAPGKRHHGVQVRRADGALRQVLVALLQVAGKVQGAVAVYAIVGLFDLIQYATHLWRRESGMVQESDKLLERALEVDIVLPERVVGVDQKELAGHRRGGLGARRKGTSNTASTSTGTPP